jgi:hypothetical protein
MKSLVYKIPMETENDLVARVAVAAGTSGKCCESFKQFSIT